jgi:hypothetical protein
MDDQTLHHFMEDLSAILIGLATIVAAAWVIGTIVRAYKERSNLRIRTDLFTRLLDKFGSSSEFVDYLQSETGRQFFEELPVQTSAPMNKIINSIQRGVILTLLGVGLLALSNFFGSSLGGDLYIVLTVSGTVGLMIGVGFLISTGIAYYLSKSWGLLATPEKSESAQQTVSKF